MNTGFALRLTAAAVAACVASGAGAAAKDGTFTGTGNGRGGQITAAVTFKGGKIADVKITKQTETVGVSDSALRILPKEIVEKNTLKLNAVSGATLTSRGILEAVRNAIKAAGGTDKDFMTAPVVVKKTAKAAPKETKDSPELAYKDIMKAGKNKNDPVLVHMTTQNAGKVVDWLIDDLKIPYGPAATQYPDHSANRQLGVEGRSVNFLRLMSNELKKHGGVIMTDTRAQKFILDKKGNVIGVKARLADGAYVNFSEKATILASGGYGANRSMLPKKVAQGLFYGLDSDSGDGLKMGREIGARTINLDLVKQYPQGVETTPHHGLAATASSTDTMKKSGAIYVNSDGRRIVDELQGLGTLTDVTKAQKGQIMYIVMDQAAWKEYVAKSLEDKLVASEADLYKWEKIVNNGRPVMAEGKTLAEAAKKMGINPAQLQKTVDRWNGFVKAGKDADFGRKVLKPLAGGPYYIVEQKVRFCTTLGGLKANGSMQILKKNGKPIGNLYGAGCVVGGANGADSMTAMMNSWAIISGYVAADSAVKSLKK